MTLETRARDVLEVVGAEILVERLATGIGFGEGPVWDRAGKRLIFSDMKHDFNNFLAAMPLIRAGRLRVLAVTSARRSQAMPELPTMAEAGLPGLNVTGWYGVLVLAGTPQANVAKIQANIAAALRVPAVNSRLSSEGAEPVGSTADQFAKFLQIETQKWAKMIKDARIRPENL